MTSLLSLQHADSFFPSGGIALSAGLETLFDDKTVSDAAAVEAFLRGQLWDRWATFDRPALVAASRAASDIERLAELDLLMEAQTLAEESRAGSSRAGRALLGVHVKLGTPNAMQYQQLIIEGRAWGHNAVMQGLVWRGCGIAEPEIEIMSAHLFCVGIVGAALRLGAIGHIDGQRIISSMHSTLERILEEPPCDADQLSAFVPEQEIAVMRHETMAYRLFAN